MKIFQKGEKDFFTNIDWSIQKIIENYLNFYFPNIKIIGEEDTTNNLIESDIFHVDKFLKLNWNLIPLPENIRILSIKDIKIYIDPVDATGMLILKKYEPVMILIGITYKEKPLMGFATYPLYENTNKSIIYFNIPGNGLYEYHIYEEKLYPIKINENNNKKDLIVRYNMDQTTDIGNK
jgi:3'-phosphoadenosine 5'-phosphosulfate (PAPS) 3'-phosphatase